MNDFDEATIYRKPSRREQKWKVEFDDVETALDFFSGVDCWFCESVCHDLWGVNAPHFIKKWEERKNGGVIRFYQSLDFINRQKLVAWYNCIMDKQK
jgi:hypothetical protein